jgi:hypothetical protein
MDWKLTLPQKLRTAAALIIVFLVILATNLIDSNHFSIVQTSLTSVYEDRLLAKNYIYKISRQMQMKQDILEGSYPEDGVKVNEMANDSIAKLLSKYAETRLTEKESKYFESLSSKISSLNNYEEKFGIWGIINGELASMNTAESYYTRIFDDLDALSEIQIIEGKREIFISNETINRSNLISKIEIGALIIIAVMLQLLIFIKPLK